MRLLLALAILAAPASGRGALLSLAPDSPNPLPGATLSVAVEIAEAEIGCFSFSIEYDEAVLTYLGASEGSLFADSGELTYFSDDVDDQGRPQPNDCLLGFGTAVTGPGTIAMLEFAVLSDEPTGITLRDPVLRDVDRLPLPGVTEVSAWLNGSATSAPAIRVDDALSASPNPSRGRLSFVLSGRALSSSGMLQVYDVAGRLVRALPWPAGVTHQDWDGTDQAGRPVANGVYHAHLESSYRRASTRIVRVR
jgi:hypothetical protein